MSLEIKNGRKKCQQCLRVLDLEMFRQTKSRSTGSYETKTGHSKICKACSSMNNYAYKLVDPTNLSPTEATRRQQFVEAYTILSKNGSILPAIAYKLLGRDKESRPLDDSRSSGINDMLAGILSLKDKVKNEDEGNVEAEPHSTFYRQIQSSMNDTEIFFGDADEAYAELKNYSETTLVDYADCAELIEDWFDKEASV